MVYVFGPLFVLPFFFRIYNFYKTTESFPFVLKSNVAYLTNGIYSYMNTVKNIEVCESVRLTRIALTTAVDNKCYTRGYIFKPNFNKYNSIPIAKECDAVFQRVDPFSSINGFFH